MKHEWKKYADAPQAYGDVPRWQREHRREKLLFVADFVKALAIFLLGVALLMMLSWAVMIGKP